MQYATGPSEVGQFVYQYNDPHPFPIYGEVLEIGEFVTVEWHDEFNERVYVTDDSLITDLYVLVTK